MRCMHLEGTAQLLRSWNQIRNVTVISCSTLIFQVILFITVATRNPAFAKLLRYQKKK